MSEAAFHNDRATQLMSLGRYAEALPMLTVAIGLDPALAVARSNLATCHFALRQLPEARVAYRMAAAADRTFIYPRVQALALARELCEWEQWDEQVAELRALAPSAQNTAPQLDLLFLPLQPEELRQHAQSSAGPGNAWSPVPRRTGSPRVSIGYVSDEIRNHVVGSTLVEVLELHDRSRFDIHLFDWGKAGNSIVERRMRRAKIRVHDIASMDDAQAASLIASLGIDVLVDLKGYTSGRRADLFRRHAAPLQVGWLGYPGTLGAAYMDYIVADPFVIPRGEEGGYTEKVLRLPCVCLPGDRQRPIADTGNRAVYGLPEEAIVFCYFGRSAKITPDVFADWMDILSAVPHSVLWLRADNDLARANLIRSAMGRGVAPGRLVFFRDGAHMRASDLIARYRFADLALDTHPYGSHVTASDALWAGCPLLTRVGRTYASRVAGSLLTQLGLESLVTTTRDEFRSVAIELARAPDRLRELRAALARARETGPTFDTPRLTRALERAFSAIVQRHDRQMPPANLDIPVD